MIVLIVTIQINEGATVHSPQYYFFPPTHKFKVCMSCLTQKKKSNIRSLSLHLTIPNKRHNIITVKLKKYTNSQPC